MNLLSFFTGTLFGCVATVVALVILAVSMDKKG